MPSSQNDSFRSLLIEAVELAQAGDSEAFRPLFECYKSEIYGYIVGLTSNAEVAHDLSQETFLKAWEKLPHSLLIVLLGDHLRLPQRMPL